MSNNLKSLIVDIHIPFCIHQVRYLTGQQLVGSNEEKDAYMAALKRELLSWADELEGYSVRALRLSGGNATVMSPDLLGDLLRTARQILPVDSGAEVSLDAQPLTIGTPVFTGLAIGRPNRMELMMHSAFDEELQTLECPHTVQHLKNAILFFNRFHVNNYGLAVDLGIPGQTAESWLNTLRACTIIHPAHISVQALHIGDWEEKQDEDLLFAMYSEGCNFLKENGYVQYAADAFCLPRHACQYTELELDGTCYVGLGLGAVTLLDGYLTRNTNSLAIYMQHAGDFEKTTAELYSTDLKFKMNDYIRKRLRTVDGVSLSSFTTRFGQPLTQELKEMFAAQLENGLLTATESGFSPTKQGLFRSLYQ